MTNPHADNLAWGTQAENIADKLDQESVILEIQKNGVLKYSYTVGPEAA